MDSKLQIALKLCAYIILSMILAHQALQIVADFLGKKTLFSISLNDSGPMPLPAITLCPGNAYNIKRMMDFNKSITFTTTLPPPPEGMNVFEFFGNVSYIMNKDFTLQYSAQPGVIANLSLGTNMIEDVMIHVSELLTFNDGLCYVIASNETFNGSIHALILYIEFLIPPEEIPDKFFVFVGEKEEWHGLTYTSLKGTLPFRDEIEVGKTNAVFLNKHVWNYYGDKGSCYSYEGLSEYQKCYADAFSQSLIEHGANCSYPGANELLNFSNFSWPACQDMPTTTSIEGLSVASARCQRPCFVNQYVGYVKHYSIGTIDNKTFMGFFMESTVVATHKENLLYDETSLIGTVGGLMGLFIGFSFYDFAVRLIDFAFERKLRIL